MGRKLRMTRDVNKRALSEDEDNEEGNEVREKSKGSGLNSGSCAVGCIKSWSNSSQGLLISSITLGIPACCGSTDEVQRSLNMLLLILIGFTDFISNTRPSSLLAIPRRLKRVS